jgi:hypothetical protein
LSKVNEGIAARARGEAEAKLKAEETAKFEQQLIDMRKKSKGGKMKPQELAEIEKAEKGDASAGSLVELTSSAALPKEDAGRKGDEGDDAGVAAQRFSSTSACQTGNLFANPLMSQPPAVSVLVAK